MFLWVLSWFACAIQLGFGILCVAAGLYYLAELVEEYTVIARKIITLIVWVVAVVHVCIWLWEDIPAFVIGTGFLANATCALLLKNFPFVSLSSTRFLSAIVMLSVNHYVAFQFFTTVYYPFSEILAYFTVCLWLVPFTYFVSLSANENVLPTTTPIVTVHNDGDAVADALSSKRSRRYGILSVFNYIFHKATKVMPTRTKTK